MATAYDAAVPYDANVTFDGNPPTATPAALPQYTLRVTDLAGEVGYLPTAVLDQVAFEASTKSALTFSITEGQPGYELVDHYSLIELLQNGVLVDDGQWTVRVKNRSFSEMRKVKQITAFHRLWDALDRTQVSDPGQLFPRRYNYLNRSPGFILNDLLLEARDRNVRTIKDLTWTFTHAVDSNGRAWPTVFTIEYKHGTPYADVFANWVDRGEIEVRLRGNDLQLFVAEKMGVQSGVNLIVGKDLTEAPVTSSSEGIAGVQVVTGDEDITVNIINPDTIARYGREELSESQGGTSDRNSLILVGEQLVNNSANPREQRTYGVVIRSGGPMPIRDYKVSDYVVVSEITEGMLVEDSSYRVRQIVLTFNDGRLASASLVLNDKFLDAEIRMAKKVAGILGGATVVGSSRAAPPGGIADNTIPKPPGAPSVVVAAYLDDNGRTVAGATVTVNPPTENTDNTNADDVDHFRLWWKYTAKADSQPWRTVESDDPIWYLNPLEPGVDVTVFAQARDRNNNWSTYGPSTTFRTDKDTTPPPVLPAPELTSYLGTIGAAWNGLGDSGVLMPTDFRHAVVYTSLINGFDPDTAGVMQGVLTGPGDLIVTGYKIGDVVYSRFVAVDLTGNRSAASAQASVTVHGVSGPDIEFGTISANHLGVGSVNAQAIQSGAVTTDKLTLGQTMNLVQDPSFNSSVWRARRLSTEFAEQPGYWFFLLNASLGRNGACLQMLSTPSGVNGGRMFMTDWINVQMGEKYYVSCMNRRGGVAPPADARIHIGIEVEKTDGTLVTDFMEVNPSNAWFRDGYNLPVQQDWKRIRYWLRAFQLYAGDFLIDDFEVRSMVGTTALTGGRVEVTPLGIRMWNDLDQETVTMESLFGDVSIVGTILSGRAGRRIEINPGATYVPEIRFFPTTGNQFAYINAIDSGGGGVPFIGVNAPDTGIASQAMVLWDSGFRLGEIDKNVGNIAGAAVQGVGAGYPAYLELHGRLSGGTIGTETMASYVYNLGAGPTGANNITLSMTKPPTPVTGQWMLLYSIRRSGTSQQIVSSISAVNPTYQNVLVQTIGGGTFTNVVMYLSTLWVRGDGDA